MSKVVTNPPTYVKVIRHPYKGVSLDIDTMRTIDGLYVLDRYLLLCIFNRTRPAIWHRRRVQSVHIQVPVLFINTKQRFDLDYDGKNLSIGCYRFGQAATRIIIRWAWEAIA
jgi:hypothetical protein